MAPTSRTPRESGATRRPTYRPRVRRALAVALVGALGVATPALASDELEDIRERLAKVEQERRSAADEREAGEQRVEDLHEEHEHFSAELETAQARLAETEGKVEQARVVLDEAELDLADAEAETERIEGELAVARENEAQIEDSIEQVASDQEQTRSTVGAIARESYKEGGMGSLATTLELLSGEADAVDQMSMARTVLRVQDQQIQQLATQEAEQVAEQDRLTGIRSDIDYLLAKAEANVIAKEQARAAADAAKVELEELEAQQEQAKADLETEKTKVEESLAAEEQRAQDLESELAALAETKHGLQTEEEAELQRIAEEEARRKAEEEARRKAAAEAAAKKAAEEEAARQRAAEREAERQRAAQAEAQRLRDEAAAAEAARRAEAAEAEAAAAAQAAQEAAEREAAERAAEEERASRAAEEERSAAEAGSSGVLSSPVNAPITSEFGNRFHPVYQMWRLHAGMDFGAGCGTPVVAAADGVVYSSYFDAGGGNMVIVDHGVQRGVNLTTSYLHFQSAAVVSAGQSVSRGQLLGYVGTTGSSTGCHLHFETRENGAPANPRGWL